MNGPEHYRMAERILARADKAIGLGAPAEAISLLMAGAQVHATLATAAATALVSLWSDDLGDDAFNDAANDWHHAITAAVPAASDRQGGDETPSGTTDGGDTVNSRQRANQ